MKSYITSDESSFRGGWHLFGGGIAGIQHIRPADDDVILMLEFVDSSLCEGIRPDDMAELEPGAGDECDGWRHYIMLPRAYAPKENFEGGRIGDRKPIYMHDASWSCAPRSWTSIRDWVAECVEEVEGMVERGEKAPYDYEEDEEDLNETDGDGDEDKRNTKSDAEHSKTKVEAEEGDDEWEKVEA